MIQFNASNRRLTGKSNLSDGVGGLGIDLGPGPGPASAPASSLCGFVVDGKLARLIGGCEPKRFNLPRCVCCGGARDEDPLVSEFELEP